MQRRFHSGRDLSRCLSIEELRGLARRRLPAFVLEYLEGGAEDEVTLRRNREVFERLAFVPRTLVDVSNRHTAVEVLGERLPLPLAIAPTGANGLFARRGDLALARAAKAFGVPFIQSTVSTLKLETVAVEPGLRHWMQLYARPRCDRDDRGAPWPRLGGARRHRSTRSCSATANGRAPLRQPVAAHLAGRFDVLPIRPMLDVLVPKRRSGLREPSRLLPGRKAIRSRSPRLLVRRSTPRSPSRTSPGSGRSRRAARW